MSTNGNTYDLTPPRQPSLDDFNGASKVDDAAYPPDPPTMPNAPEWNTKCRLIVAMCQVLPVAKIDVVSNAIAQARSPISAVTAGTFTLTHVGTGTYEITWPAGTFPSSLGQPTGTTNHNAAAMVDCFMITNGVRCRTYLAGGTGADLDFTVSVY